jgi:hypothetical protein
MVTSYAKRKVGVPSYNILVSSILRGTQHRNYAVHAIIQPSLVLRYVGFGGFECVRRRAIRHLQFNVQEIINFEHLLFPWLLPSITVNIANLGCFLILNKELRQLHHIGGTSLYDVRLTPSQLFCLLIV